MKISGKNLAVYGLVSVLSLLIAAWALNLFGQDLSIPFNYGLRGDVIFVLMSIKTTIENGWYFYNPRLAAPFGLEFYDFPLADGFNLLLMKAISLFSHDSSIVMNLFFLLTFPLTAITSIFVFKRLKINNVIAVSFALLYALAPYHFYRSEHHLFLSAYYMIPLITLIVLSLWSNNIPFFTQSRSVPPNYQFNLLSKKSLFCIFICLVIGSTGIYYAFFACFFLVIACISATFNSKKNYKIIIMSTLILLSLISLSSFLNILPNLVYTHIHGVNLEVANREAMETESYSLKIINLLLPTTGIHRFPIIQRLGQLYNNQALPIIQNENTFGYLGIVGSLGFLYLLAMRVFKIRGRESDLVDRLSILNLSAFIFATIGGTSIFFALFISPQIRAYNRMSIFINFFALLTIALLLDNFFKKHLKTKGNQIIFNFLCLGILVFGIFEQSLPPSAYNYSFIRNEYESDRSFVQSIEQVLPSEAMVFQLPYIPFPENGKFLNMKDYDLFRGYLHSKTLKWSYGAVKGRNDQWYRLVTDQPLDKLLAQISAMGFSGIYIDRYGYSDKGKQLQIDLEEKLNTKPIVSSNQRLIFFDMRKFNKSL